MNAKNTEHLVSKYLYLFLLKYITGSFTNLNRPLDKVVRNYNNELFFMSKFLFYFLYNSISLHTVWLSDRSRYYLICIYNIYLSATNKSAPDLYQKSRSTCNGAQPQPSKYKGRCAATDTSLVRNFLHFAHGERLTVSAA